MFEGSELMSLLYLKTIKMHYLGAGGEDGEATMADM